MKNLWFLTLIGVFGLASCRLQTEVYYKMSGIWPFEDYNVYEFKHKGRVFTVKDSVGAYEFGDSLRLTKSTH